MAARADGPPTPRVVEPPVGGDEVYIASLVLQPAGDQVDRTGDLQQAIDRLAGIGGGVLYLEPGRYRLAGPVRLKQGVTLLGGGLEQTILAVYGGREQADGPAAITMELGTGVRHLSLWYPEQRPDAPVPYPWCLATAGGDNTTVEDVRLVNPYRGISVGPEWNELHTIRRVIGTPLMTGIRIDTTTDIGRVVDTTFDAEVWEQSGLPGAPTTEAERTALRRHLLAEATGLDMGRSDWQYLDRLTVRGYRVGVRIRPGEQGTTNGVMLDCELDGAEALRLDALNGIGLAAVRCRFVGRPTAILGPPSFETVAQFNACEIRSEPGAGDAAAVLLEGPGTLSLTHCRISGSPTALRAPRGQVLMQACAVAGATVHLGDEVRRARILGSTGDDPAVVVNESAGDVLVTAGGATPELCPEPAPSDLRWPRLPSRELILVGDHGASPQLDDNTAAFQAALDAARAAGGGTVYVPAGRYRFAGQITVPSGVELRGIFDVPHHTVSDGSVLMPVADRGTEDGAPFVSLEPNSGLRGLTFWYPEQDLREMVPYPWTIRALGPGCWLRDIACGNSYNGADFGTHPSAGHVISYLSGAFLRRGLWVSQSDGPGWVEDIQFNPHYAARLPAGLPAPEYPGDIFERLIDQQRHHLRALVFGRCADERIRRTFLYAAYDGLAFVDDGGGANATVLIHGSDTVSRPLALEAAGDRGIDCLLAQLVPLSAYEVGGIVATESFAGRARLFGNQMWAGRTGGVIQGGEVLIQQWNNATGPLRIEGGRVTVEQGLFPERDQPTVSVGPAVESARLIANVQRGAFRIANGAGDKLTARANSASLPPRPIDGATDLATGFEPGQPEPLASTVQADGGGQRNTVEVSCTVVDGVGRDGGRAVRLAGRPEAPGYGFVYVKLFDGPLAVADDTLLRYWIKPADDASRQVGVDLLFDRGQPLRDSGARTVDEQNVHPSAGRGVPGEWREIVIPLGRFAAGRTVRTIMLAYDSQQAGAFDCLLDDLSLTSETDGRAVVLTAEPAGGRLPLGATITLGGPAGTAVAYTLDGTNPTAESPVYTGPVTLDRPGLTEIRFAPKLADGAIGSVVRAALYEVLPRGVQP